MELFKESKGVEGDGSQSCSKTEKSNDFHEQQNPLINPLIVENLLYYAKDDVDCLKNVRLVCKLWFELSQKYWVKNAEIVIDTVFRIDCFLGQVNKSNNGFGELERYKISYWNLNHLNMELFGQFWNTCGHWMRELCVDTCTFKDFSEVESIVSTMTPNLVKFSYLSSKDCDKFARFRPGQNVESVDPTPQEVRAVVLQKNLKTLVVRHSNKQYVKGWNNFLTHFPNLEDVEFGTHAELDLYLFLNALSSLRRLDESRLQIKHFDIKGMLIFKYNEEILLPLINANLKLKTLRVDLLYRTEPQLAQLLLKIYAGTLETLELHRGPYAEPYRNFPFKVQFDSLTELQLHGHVAWSFAFLKNTPNLKSLTVFRTTNLNKPLHIFEEMLPIELNPQLVHITHDMVRVTAKECNMTGVRLESLEKLICGDVGIKSGQSVKLLAEWMPNVRKLSMVLDKVTFPAVCEHWPKLMELKLLSGSYVDDETITGMKDFQGASQPQDNLGSFGRAPNVTDLKSLSKFELTPPNTGNQQNCTHMLSQLTYHAVHNGFLKMSSLNKLIFYVPEMIKEDTLRAISDKVGHVEVTKVEKCTCSL